MIHILVFDPVLIKLFINPLTGKKYTYNIIKNNKIISPKV